MISLGAGYVLDVAPVQAIRIALVKALEAWPDLPAIVAWPNQQIEEPNPPVIWARPTLFFNEAVAAAIGIDAPNYWTGLLQVSIFAPSGTGDGQAIKLAGSLMSYFKRGLRLDAGVVRQLMVRAVWAAGSPVEETNWYHVPVTVSWEAYVPNK